MSDYEMKSGPADEIEACDNAQLPVRVPGELLRLKTGNFSSAVLDRFAENEFCYLSQMYYAGRDAAIIWDGDQLLAYMDGLPNTCAELDFVVYNYGDALPKYLKVLRKEKSDIVILTGVWHDVDPWYPARFEAYLVHVISADGQVATRPYELEIFDWDSPGEGRLGERNFRAASPAELSKLMRMATERVVQRDVLVKVLGDEFPIAGVIFYPVQDGLPLVVCKAVGMQKLSSENWLQNLDKWSLWEPEA